MEQRNDPARGVECAVPHLLGLVLGVVHVREWRIVRGEHDPVTAGRAERAHHAEMLDGHGVALLRHDRAALDKGIRYMQLADFKPGPLIQVLHKAANVEKHHLEGSVHTGCAIGRRDAAIGVFLEPGEAQELCHPLAIDREPGRGNGRRSHGGLVDHSQGVGQAVHVTEQHLDQRGEVVAPGGRLRGLAVRVRHDQCVAMTGRHRDHAVGQENELL